MFPNLKAEMTRRKVTNADMAKALGLHPSTLSEKLNNYDRLKYSEAKEIQQKFFPDCGTDYLFATEAITA